MTSGAARTGDPATFWRDALAAWAIPERILDRAPVSPYGFSVGHFARIADRAGADTPSVARAAEALPDGGTVLDVGCGAGAASLPLGARVGRFVGVDESEEMLTAFAARAARLGAAVETVTGRWPDVAAQVPRADVVVCRNVIFNVGDLAAFAAALTAAARARVVVESTIEHPLRWTAPFWQALHGIDRPDRPTVSDALEVLADLGLDVRVEHFDAPWLLAAEDDEALVAFLVRRLCLAAHRADEVRALLRTHPAPRMVRAAALWWKPDTS